MSDLVNKSFAREDDDTGTIDPNLLKESYRLKDLNKDRFDDLGESFYNQYEDQKKENIKASLLQKVTKEFRDPTSHRKDDQPSKQENGLKKFL